MAGLSEAIFPKPGHHQELQSALVRLLIWLFSASYIGYGAASGYYQVEQTRYLIFFAVYLVLFSGLLISVLQRAHWPRRNFVALIIDISAASMAIFLTENAISPFYLLYIWIFISYGTRYGARHLAFASVLSLIAYNLVLWLLGEWQTHTFEAVFFLLLLLLLPLYEFTLLRQLHQARQDAERANQAKSDFLAVMTHELRTPLSGLLGMSRLLQGTRLDAEQRDYVHSIINSADLLRALIGDVLDLSKIEANKLRLEAVPFDLRQAVLEVAEAFGAQALDKRLEIVCRIEPDVAEKFIGDPLRIRQILFNLLGNAVKFTQTGEIVISLSMQAATAPLNKQHIRLEVRDTGIGIAPEQLQQVFSEFWQADASTTRQFGGTGLGATIAQDLCRLMGGAISVESEQGQGSCFCVRLPLPIARENAPATAKSAHLTGRSLLIVETNRSCREWIGELCQSFGMHCRYLQHSDEAALFDSQGDVDLILLADSPDGVDLAALAKRLKKPAVLLLTYKTRRQHNVAENAGQLSKPFLPEQLRTQLTSLLSPTPAQDPQAASPAPTAETVEQQANHPSLSVLVAEDNWIAAKVISAFLHKLGHRVTHTKDGEETLAQSTQETFDIAFIDLRMPKLDGMAYTRAHRQRENGSGKRLPIIALTANTAEDVGQQSTEAGMDGLLVKPIDPEQLERTIRRFCPIAT